jgi:hypothetical protein
MSDPAPTFATADGKSFGAESNRIDDSRYYLRQPEMFTVTSISTRQRRVKSSTTVGLGTFGFGYHRVDNLENDSVHDAAGQPMSFISLGVLKDGSRSTDAWTMRVKGGLPEWVRLLNVGDRILATLRCAMWVDGTGWAEEIKVVAPQSSSPSASGAAPAAAADMSTSQSSAGPTVRHGVVLELNQPMVRPSEERVRKDIESILDLAFASELYAAYGASTNYLNFMGNSEASCESAHRASARQQLYSCDTRGESVQGKLHRADVHQICSYLRAGCRCCEMNAVQRQPYSS